MNHRLRCFLLLDMEMRLLAAVSPENVFFLINSERVKKCHAKQASPLKIIQLFFETTCSKKEFKPSYRIHRSLSVTVIPYRFTVQSHFSSPGIFIIDVAHFGKRWHRHGSQMIQCIHSSCSFSFISLMLHNDWWTFEAATFLKTYVKT